MNNFTFKVAGALGSIIVLIISLLIFLDFNAFHDESIEQYKDILRSKNESIEIAISEKIESYRKVLSSFDIGSEDTQETLSDYALIQTQTLARNLKDISEGVYLFRQDGAIYDPEGKPYDFNVKQLDRSYWKAIFNQNEQFYVSPPFVSARTGKEVIAVAYKLNQNTASLATINVESVLSKLTQRDDMFLYSHDGTILIAPYKELLGKNIYTERPLYKEFSQTSPELSYTTEINGRDVEFTSFWGNIDSTKWEYTTFIKNEIIEASAHEQLKKSMLIGLFSLIISISLVLIILKRLVLIPVGGIPNEIANFMETMAAGNLTQELQITGKETGIYLSLVNLSNKLSILIRNSHSISENVASSSTQLSTIMNTTRANSQLELEQAEQISTAINELSSTSNEVSNKAVMAEDAARTAQDSVKHGKKTLEKNITLTGDINNSVNESAKIIGELRQYAMEIGSVIEVINGISEQTNLLALNAAIEAARAGEQGRGFAVVADEVRNLASKTQQSTISIQEIIEKLQQQSEKATNNMAQNVDLIEESVILADGVKSAFESISTAVESISEINTLVATASQQQYCVTEEISQSTTHTYDLVKKNVVAVEETLQAAHALSTMASDQKNELSYFTV
nr:methyl-accepting chemotaxis protein [uncultured Vibrio sp.]